MNNWIVEGGNFHFDGYRARLRVDQQPRGEILFLDHPWKLFQEEVDTPGLVVSMDQGVVVSSNSSTLAPENELVEYTKTALSDDSTIKFWVKISVAKTTFNTVFQVWYVTASVVETGASVPADTLDVTTNTAGDLFYEIGEVVTLDGVVTTITQALKTPITVIFPMQLIGPETGDHVLTSIDGVVSWTEAGPLNCPE